MPDLTGQFDASAAMDPTQFGAQYTPQKVAANLADAQNKVQANYTGQIGRLDTQLGQSPMPQIPQQQKKPLMSKDDLQAHIGLFSAMLLISALAGRKTSAPATAAMNNMTASLKGLMEGNSAIHQSENDQMWKNYDAMMEQHKSALEQYKIGITKLYADPKKNQNDLYLELLKDNYPPTLAAELSNDVTAGKMLDGITRAHQHAQDVAAKLKMSQDRITALEKINADNKAAMAKISTDKSSAEAAAHKAHDDATKRMNFEKERADLYKKKASTTDKDLMDNIDQQIRAVDQREKWAFQSENAPAGKTGAKTVVNTGMLNGKYIVHYSDGTTTADGKNVETTGNAD